MIASVMVGFRYMLNYKLSIVRMMVVSRKFILLFSSSSNVNRSVGVTVFTMLPRTVALNKLSIPGPSSP
jgi:hypothetical protein